MTTQRQANRSHFQRGTGVFACDTCGRQTRQTNGIDGKICAECYELAGWENTASDYGPEEVQWGDVRHQLDKIEERGGADCRAKAEAAFSDLLKKMPPPLTIEAEEPPVIDFTDVPTSELIAAYNDLAEPLGHKPVTKFADRATAEKRTRLAISSVSPEKRPGRWNQIAVAEKLKPLIANEEVKITPKADPVEVLTDQLVTGAAKSQAQAALRSAPAKTSKDAEMPALRKAAKPLELPAKSKVYARKAGTKQALLVDMLSRPEGATFGELYDALAATGKPWRGVTIRSGLAWDINHITGYGVATEMYNGEQFAAQALRSKATGNSDRAYEAERLGMVPENGGWAPGPGYDPNLKLAVYRLTYPAGMKAPLPHIQPKG